MTEPWTSLRLIQWTTSFFEKKGIPNPRLDAELLLAHVLQCKRIELYTSFEKEVSEKHLTPFRALIERRATREPLQYILGDTEFWGLKIKVTPEVLIPRPETELLVEEVLKEKPARILEIGTGSGCISIALAKHLPEAKVIATDISQKSLDVARENAKINGVDSQIEFHLADIAPWKEFQAQGLLFDQIVSNPPYIPTGELECLQEEVRDHEPRRALDGGSNGLDLIHRLIEEALPFLKPGGSIHLEVGEKQAQHIPGVTRIRKDYAGTERIVIIQK